MFPKDERHSSACTLSPRLERPKVIVNLRRRQCEPDILLLQIRSLALALVQRMLIRTY